MRLLTRWILCATVTIAPVSLALAGGTPQNHHCMKDGSELTGKTRRQCKKEGGTWDKDAAKPAPAAPPAAPAKPEAKPAPKAN
jgi:hypothetical protein